MMEEAVLDLVLEEERKPKAKRGTSNGNSSGSSEDRRRRKIWLLETYRADVDLWTPIPIFGPYEVPAGSRPEDVEKCCRCYRCGILLTILTMTVDRIVPGCKGGTYRRENVRPACGSCNSEVGGGLRRA